MNKPEDWPGTDAEWEEYQEFLEEDKPKPEDKIVAALEKLTLAVAAIPDTDSGYELLAKRMEMLVIALSANIPKPVTPKKWEFIVHRDEKDQIVNIIAGRE